MTAPLILDAGGPGAGELLARIHREAFDPPWSADEFASLIAQPGVRALSAGPDGFILLRTVADEAEILTLAVRPAARRAGLGRRLVEAAAVAAARSGARRLFLEVARDNPAAVGLYQTAGFVEAGVRPGYYRRSDSPAADALILARNLC